MGLEGDSYFLVAASAGLPWFGGGWSWVGGAGVPKMARLKARAAKTGAGVSGCSTKVSSVCWSLCQYHRPSPTQRDTRQDSIDLPGAGVGAALDDAFPVALL